jgi:hypothetical protein
LPFLNSLSRDIYYISFPKDRILLKIAIVWVYLAGVTQTGLALLDFYISFTSELLYFFGGGVIHFQRDHLWLSITALTGAGAKWFSGCKLLPDSSLSSGDCHSIIVCT